MGVLVKKLHDVSHLSQVMQLSIVGLLVSFAGAAMNTVWAIYLAQFLGSDVAVGIFSTFLTVVAFLSFFVFVPIVEKYNKAKLFALSLIISVVTFLIFSVNTSFAVLVVLATVLIITVSLRIVSFGILVRDTSDSQGLAKNEGLVFTFANIAFVVAPLLAGFLAARYGISLVFVVCAIAYAAGLVYFTSTNVDGSGGKKRLDKSFAKNFRDFFKKKDRVIAYLLGSGTTMWWILIYLFIPLEMIRRGFSEWGIGVFLFAVALPLIFFEYLFSKKASRIGFRKLFVGAHIMLTIFAILCFFFSANFFVVAGLLVLASVAMAALEPTKEAYFFDILKGKERYRFYGPYATAIDFGNLAAKLLGTATLFFLPFKYIFLAFGLLMAALILVSLKTKSIYEARRGRKRVKPTGEMLSPKKLK